MTANGDKDAPTEIAEAAGLTYMSDEEPGIRRRRRGKGFGYVMPDGKTCRDKATLERIRSLAIPPAWTDVWICRKANGHLQATGRDARGRKQYIYHPAFRDAREANKFAHILSFARTLPLIRAEVARDMARRGLPRDKVIATVVHLLETTLIRIGNPDYARENKSYGLTTLRDPHVKINGSELRFRFTGKSGKVWRLRIKDRRVARVVKACQDLPGQKLFQYLDEEGTQRDVTSSDVNEYLRRITGEDITAKDFRTWAGTVLAALALEEFGEVDSKTLAKANIRAAIQHVANRLGNTVSICRKCYIHPVILESYPQGFPITAVRQEIESELLDRLSGLEPEEAAVLAFLESRLRADQRRLAAARR